MASSTDGQVMWWDIRKLSEPTETMVLDIEKNGTIVGGTALDFETTMVSLFLYIDFNGNAQKWRNKANQIHGRYGDGSNLDVQQESEINQ